MCLAVNGSYQSIPYLFQGAILKARNNHRCATSRSSSRKSLKSSGQYPTTSTSYGPKGPWSVVLLRFYTTPFSHFHSCPFTLAFLCWKLVERDWYSPPSSGSHTTTPAGQSMEGWPPFDFNTQHRTGQAKVRSKCAFDTLHVD